MTTTKSPLWERIIAVVTGFLIVAFIAFLLYRNEDFANPNFVIYGRLLLALGIALCAATLPGFLRLKWDVKGASLRAGGAIALFIFTLAYTPKVLPSLGTAGAVASLSQESNSIKQILAGIDRIVEVLGSQQLKPAQRSAVDALSRKKQIASAESQNLESGVSQLQSHPENASLVALKDLSDRAEALRKQVIDLETEIKNVVSPPEESPQPTAIPNPTRRPGNSLTSPAAEPTMTFEVGNENWTIKAPFTRSGDFISQLANGEHEGSSRGQARLDFTVAADGPYLIQALVEAPSDSSNSFLVNIDGVPSEPEMIWDIPLTSGFEVRLVSWRGSGTAANAEFVPKLFNLSKGAHQLIIYGRKANTRLKGVSVEKALNPPTGLRTIR